jgi:hypothetical protein
MENSQQIKLQLLIQEKYLDIEYIKYFDSNIMSDLRGIYQSINTIYEYKEVEEILKTYINPIEFEHIFDIVQRSIKYKYQPQDIIALIWEDMDDYITIIKRSISNMNSEIKRIEKQEYKELEMEFEALIK